MTLFSNRTTEALKKELAMLEDRYARKFGGLNNHARLTEWHQQIQALKEEIQRREAKGSPPPPDPIQEN
jgi:hypothetical protein